MDDAIPLLEEVASAIRKLEDSRRFISIIFVDLKDSTSYKSSRGERAGVQKSLRHNVIASKIINQFDGEVVKYIGDEVMGMFAGADGPKRAIITAAEIISALDKVNLDENLKGMD